MKPIFLYLLLILSLLLTACDGKESSMPQPELPGLDFEFAEGMNLGGKVLIDNEPAAGIPVSDGYSISLTDAQGTYQIKRHENAKFVFVTLPANCKVPVQGNIARLYAPLSANEPLIRNHFLLEAAETETDFTLIAVADPQVGSQYELSRLKNEGAHELGQLGKSNLAIPHYGILLGDIVWDKPALFQDVKNVLTGLDYPLFGVIGNHDHDLNIVNDDTRAAHAYEAQFGPRYYSFNRGECHFVMLDNIDYAGGPDKEYTARISDEQLEWLRKDLEHVDKNKLIILSVHIPIKRRNSGSQTANSEELCKILEGYKVEILSAHTHYNVTTTISDDIHEHTHGAICGAFWSGDINVDGTPNGYGVYEISGNRIKNNYYKSVRKPRSYQIRAYNENSLPPVSGKIVANIWNWDTDWTVKIYENGENKGDMTPFEKDDYDPFAYDFLSKNPSSHPYPTVALAAKTDHLFQYVPENPAAKIKIEATDTYGNIYTCEL